MKTMIGYLWWRLRREPSYVPRAGDKGIIVMPKRYDAPFPLPDNLPQGPPAPKRDG
jgi:hypothetical protein